MSFDVVHPWKAIAFSLYVLSPLLVFALGLSLGIYILFVALLPRLSLGGRWIELRTKVRRARKADGLRAPRTAAADATPGATEELHDSAAQTAAGTPALSVDEFGYLVGPSYVVMASVFGIVVGGLVRLAGGFSGLILSAAPGAGSLISAIVAALTVAIGVAGTLFADGGKISLRRPVGAIAFLASFLVAGVYFQYLPAFL